MALIDESLYGEFGVLEGEEVIVEAPGLLQRYSEQEWGGTLGGDQLNGLINKVGSKELYVRTSDGRIGRIVGFQFTTGSEGQTQIEFRGSGEPPF